jgi:hypothetical protein
MTGQSRDLDKLTKQAKGHKAKMKKMEAQLKTLKKSNNGFKGAVVGWQKQIAGFKKKDKAAKLRIAVLEGHKGKFSKTIMQDGRREFPARGGG